MIGSIGAHTNGFLLNFRYAKYFGGFSKKVYEIEIANIKHVQETKSFSPFEENIRGYVYGKLNTFITLRPSIGYHKVFIPKQSIHGVSVTYITQFGASIGIAKPVYLNIQKREQNSFRTFLVKEKYDPEKHFPDNIYGRTSYFNGIDEMKLYPGGFAKVGIQFDYANERDFVKALEVGIKLDVFAEKIPILAFEKNRRLFLNLYLAISYGKKETRN